LARTVRLISSEGEQLGIIPIRDALNIAAEEGLDLVEVSANSDPPVCRIMDYGKFRYEISKRGKDARKKSRASQLKEIKLRPHTEEHDLGVKIKSLRKFLEKKDRVKITVFYRGREMAYVDQGISLLERVAEDVKDLGSVDQLPGREARNRVSMVILPK